MAVLLVAVVVAVALLVAAVTEPSTPQRHALVEVALLLAAAIVPSWVATVQA